MGLLNEVRDTLIAAAMERHDPLSGGPVDGVTGLQSVLREADHTIFPRTIRAVFDRGTSLKFVVRNRRILRIESETAPASEFVGVSLGPDQAEALADWLERLCQGQSFFGLDVRAAANPHSESAALGIAPASIARALEIQSPPPGAQDLEAGINRFIATHADHISAAFLVAGEDVVALHGSEDAIEAVTQDVFDVLAHITGDSFALAAALETDGALLLPRGGPDSDTLFVVGAVGLIGLLVLSSGDELDPFQAWRAITTTQ